jgi:hypothetical protein
MNASNYFKEKILKKHKEDVGAMFRNIGKEIVTRKQKIMLDMMKGN